MNKQAILQRQVRWVQRSKPIIFIVCLLPLIGVVVGIFMGKVPDPVKALTHVTGETGLRLLVVTLMITPLRWVTGFNPIIRVRRMLGVFAFFYALIHFCVWAVLDQSLSLNAIVVDIIKRKYILVGFIAFVIMTALAVTSTNGMVRRLGGKAWQKLHRLVYVAAIAVALHYIWLAKAEHAEPFIYAAVIAGLLLWRLLHSRTKKVVTSHATAS